MSVDLKGVFQGFQYQLGKQPSGTVSARLPALRTESPLTASALQILEDRIDGQYRLLSRLSTTDLPFLNIRNASGKLVAYLGTKGTYEGGAFSELYIGPTAAEDPSTALITCTASGLTIDGSVVLTGTVTAGALNIALLTVEGLSITNNSPGAGSIAWGACTAYYAGTAYSISGNNTSSKFVYWDVGNSTFTAADSFTPQPGRFPIATNTSGTGDIVWHKLGLGVIQAANIPDGELPDAKISDLSANKLTAGTIDASIITVTNLSASNISTGTLSATYISGGTLDCSLITVSNLNAGSITAGTLDTSRLSVKQIIVSGLTLTNNSPGAGSVAWSACTVYYNGTAYSIAGNNSNSALIYWDAGNSTFTAGASFTPQTGRFLIATNDSGTGAECWNTLPPKGIQEANLGFTLPAGYEPQAIQTTPLDVTTNGTGTLWTVSGFSGYLMKIGVLVGVAPAGTSTLAKIGWKIDGGSEYKMTIYQRTGGASVSYVNGRVISSKIDGNMTSVGDNYSIDFAVPFTSSLEITYNVSGVTAMSAGTLTILLWYAVKL